MDGYDTSSTLSSSESNEYHEHNMWNPILELLCHAHIGVCMEAYLDEVDMGRIALSCHFTLDVLCDKTSSLLLVNGQVFVGEPIQIFLSRDDSLNLREASQHSQHES